MGGKLREGVEGEGDSDGDSSRRGVRVRGVEDGREGDRRSRREVWEGWNREYREKVWRGE